MAGAAAVEEAAAVAVAEAAAVEEAASAVVAAAVCSIRAFRASACCVLHLPPCPRAHAAMQQQKAQPV